MSELTRKIFEGDVASVSRLIEGTSDLEAIDSNGKTPLIQAVECENIRVIEMFLDHGAQINHSDRHGFSPLHLAVDISIDGTIQSGSCLGDEPTDIIELLISRGASLSVRTEDGETPIDIAIQYGSKKIEGLLSGV